MSVLERFRWLLNAKKITLKEFAQKSGFGESALKAFNTGRTEYPRLDFCFAVKKVFPYVSLDWLVMGEGEKWISAPPEWMDPDWSATGNTAENIPAHEAKLLEESSAKEIAQAESIVMKLLLRELKRMRQDMKTKNPELIEEYGLDELLDDILE